MGQWDLSLVRLAADPGSPQGGPCDRACLGVDWQGGAPTPGPGMVALPKPSAQPSFPTETYLRAMTSLLGDFKDSI